ncbi:MAG: hypothetical protein ACOX5Q_00880 [Bacillota bacterium]
MQARDQSLRVLRELLVRHRLPRDPVRHSLKRGKLAVRLRGLRLSPRFRRRALLAALLLSQAKGLLPRGRAPRRQGRFPDVTPGIRLARKAPGSRIKAEEGNGHISRGVPSPAAQGMEAAIVGAVRTTGVRGEGLPSTPEARSPALVE